MQDDGSVSSWLQSLRKDDQDAARLLWERYFSGLVTTARRELRRSPKQGAYDEEDVALSAFDVFCQGIRQGNFEELSHRDELWRLLVVVTVRKAHDRAKSELAAKRGGGHKAKRLEDLTVDENREYWGEQEDPQSAAAMAEQCQQLMQSLDDPDLEKLALWKLDGMSNAEIARHLGCTRQTVQRRLRLIRDIWKNE